VKYLSRYSSLIKEDYNKEIQEHLKKARQEIRAALVLLQGKKRRDILFRVACRSTEQGLERALNLLNQVPIVKPIPQPEVATKAKPKRVRERRGER